MHSLLSKLNAIVVFVCVNRYSVEALAEMFRIRQQRVMAILALQEAEAEALKSDPANVDNELQQLMDEEVHFCNEGSGSNERHYTVLPSYPNYQVKI